MSKKDSLSNFVFRQTRRRRPLASFLFLLLLVEPVLFPRLSSATQKGTGRRRARQQLQTLSEEQQINQVLARLTFGARPGDKELVRKIGVSNYIAQQLDPDSIDDSLLEAKLAKLPTLNMATPSLVEQYNPPKAHAK